jgi:hypothetical protein
MTTEAAAPGPENMVLLYWLPLGAGGHFVRWNGRLYEALTARREHRPARNLYHSALEVRLDGDRFVIEMAPVWAIRDADRGVVCEGPVRRGLAASPPSSTRYGAGAEAGFPTSPKRLTAHRRSAGTRLAPSGCWAPCR